MKLLKGSSRRPPRRFAPAPTPGRGGAQGALVRLAKDLGVPALPTCVLGAPMARPPGLARPAPRQGGIRGLSVPPELRRRAGMVQAAQGATDIAERERLALRAAQIKLLDARQKLEIVAATLRSQLSLRGS